MVEEKEDELVEIEKRKGRLVSDLVRRRVSGVVEMDALAIEPEVELQVETEVEVDIWVVMIIEGPAVMATEASARTVLTA